MVGEAHSPPPLEKIQREWGKVYDPYPPEDKQIRETRGAS